jgi:hypothetical protein
MIRPGSADDLVVDRHAGRELGDRHGYAHPVVEKASATLRNVKVISATS